jgi:hypothetical protein
MEQRVLIKTVLARNVERMLEDLRSVRILLGRPVTDLFQQRQIDHRGRVALRPRIAVPVPGTAKIAALLDDADILDARFLQAGPRDKTREAPADEREGHVITLGRTLGQWRIGILEIMRQLPLDLDILRIAIRAQPLVALLAILAP